MKCFPVGGFQRGQRRRRCGGVSCPGSSGGREGRWSGHGPLGAERPEGGAGRIEADRERRPGDRTHCPPPPPGDKDSTTRAWLQGCLWGPRETSSCRRFTLPHSRGFAETWGPARRSPAPGLQRAAEESTEGAQLTRTRTPGRPRGLDLTRTHNPEPPLKSEPVRSCKKRPPCRPGGAGAPLSKGVCPHPDRTGLRVSSSMQARWAQPAAKCVIHLTRGKVVPGATWQVQATYKRDR